MSVDHPRKGCGSLYIMWAGIEYVHCTYYILALVLRYCAASSSVIETLGSAGSGQFGSLGVSWSTTAPEMSHQHVEEDDLGEGGGEREGVKGGGREREGGRE